jgi:natural product biosynthesis luciferase-like monooxygenase protein
MKFSLFFFSADADYESTRGERYRLVVEAARFADEHGFSAVWTPERHFHKFGAAYPNPSTMACALAMVTQRVEIRAGSLVLPLHHPVRVAEDWAVADNLSGGRVAISVASGWNVNDFVLCPQNFRDRQEIMFRSVEILRRLWAGESVRMPGVDGAEVEVRTFPRPVQERLPIWVTSAGRIETWVKAGEIGANVLTHLVRQGFDNIAEKVKAYRAARARCNHDPAGGVVSLMMHAFVGEDVDEVRRIVRPPLTDYLLTSSEVFATPDPTSAARAADPHARGEARAARAGVRPILRNRRAPRYAGRLPRDGRARTRGWCRRARVPGRLRR